MLSRHNFLIFVCANLFSTLNFYMQTGHDPTKILNMHYWLYNIIRCHSVILDKINFTTWSARHWTWYKNELPVCMHSFMLVGQVIFSISTNQTTSKLKYTSSQILRSTTNVVWSWTFKQNSLNVLSIQLLQL